MNILMPTRDDILELCKEKMKFYSQCKATFGYQCFYAMCKVANKKQVFWTNLYNKTISSPIEYWKNFSVVQKMAIMTEIELKKED